MIDYQTLTDLAIVAGTVAALLIAAARHDRRQADK